MGHLHEISCDSCRYTASYLDATIAGSSTHPRVCTGCGRITTGWIPNPHAPHLVERPSTIDAEVADRDGLCSNCGDPAPRLEEGSACPRCGDGRLQIEVNEGLIVD